MGPTVPTLEASWYRGIVELTVAATSGTALGRNVPLLRSTDMPKLETLPEGLPYDPLRTTLYTAEELLAPFGTAAPDGPLESTVDYAIYDHFSRLGRRAPSREEAYAERLHDWSIDEALRRFLGEPGEDGYPRGESLVAIMGGHGKARSSAEYREVARLAQLLAAGGVTVASGGGPGIMEATNLGAALGSYPQSAVDEAVQTLSACDDYTLPDYIPAARRVLAQFPERRPSLAVPTWFYGHEPTNLFGSHIAKYFSNGLREDTLLAIARGGVVFAPGKAGTWQEIFMDLAQNFYVTFDVISPMIFLGRAHYERDTSLFPLVERLARLSKHGEALLENLALVDSAEEAASFLRKRRPVSPQATGHEGGA
jgi:predicted Rossmann-fold nucleotide-binding protein